MPDIDLSGLPDKTRDIDLSGLPDKTRDMDLSGLPDKVTPIRNKPIDKTYNDKSFMDVVKKRLLESSLQSTPIAQQLGMLGEALGLPQKVATAAVPHGKGTFTEKLERGKMPSEFLDVFGKPKTETDKAWLESMGFMVDIVADPLVIPGAKITKGIGKVINLTDDFAKAISGATKSLGTEMKLGGVTREITQGLVKKKWVDALKGAKVLRGQQEKIYTAERAKKISDFKAAGKGVSGEQRFYKQKGQLTGEMEKVEFTSLRKEVGQSDVDALFDQINEFEGISEWEKIPAQTGLAKIFGEAGGAVPTEGEIKLLEKVFGSDLSKELLKKQSLFTKFKKNGLEIANIPRSVMTSADLSFGFRQGVFVAAKHPKIFFKNFAKQFKMFGSEKYYQEMMKEIRTRPNFGKMQDSGLPITDLGVMSQREEAFMSNFAEKLPLGIGKTVRASGRAYTGFANRLRADLFDYMVDYGNKFGKGDNVAYLESAADFIGNATGRGKIPFGGEKIATTLNAVFFSPRLLASRINLLNPYYYWKLDPLVRKEALKSLAAFGGMATTVTGLAKMAGADVGIDPRSADFGKIKVGNTRYDVMGGFQQPIRAMSQILSGKIVSSTTGKEMTLGEGYKPMTVPEIALRFFEMKESPLMSFAVSMSRGTNAIGEKFDLPTEIANRFIPMVAQDMNDLYNERGFEGIPMAVPAIFGFGAQTYGGVQTWGLNGTDYPKLNKELLRLKTTMGFPSSSAFGYEFDLGEYKKFKAIAGRKIAEELTREINTEAYNKSSDVEKKMILGKYIDKTKEVLKKEIFTDKLIRSKIRSKLKKSGVEDNDLEEAVDNILKESGTK